MKASPTPPENGAAQHSSSWEPKPQPHHKSTFTNLTLSDRLLEVLVLQEWRPARAMLRRGNAIVLVGQIAVTASLHMWGGNVWAEFVNARDAASRRVRLSVVNRLWRRDLPTRIIELVRLHDPAALADDDGNDPIPSPSYSGEAAR